MLYVSYSRSCSLLRMTNWPGECDLLSVWTVDRMSEHGCSGLPWDSPFTGVFEQERIRCICLLQVCGVFWYICTCLVAEKPPPHELRSRWQTLPCARNICLSRRSIAYDEVCVILVEYQTMEPNQVSHLGLIVWLFSRCTSRGRVYIWLPNTSSLPVASESHADTTTQLEEIPFVIFTGNSKQPLLDYRQQIGSLSSSLSTGRYPSCSSIKDDIAVEANP